MKSVNPKSKAKTKQSPLPTWYRFSFYFPSIQVCNEAALPVAAMLRVKFPHVYFARYTGAMESRLDVIVRSHGATALTQEHVNALMKASGNGCRWQRIEGPTPCTGSLAHATAFEFVVRFHALVAGCAQDEGMDAQARFELWNDVIHWAHNMAGYDYIDESRCYLHGLGKIMTVFEQSIKLGNQMACAQKKAARKTRKPFNN
jgi:hypothetical protein